MPVFIIHYNVVPTLAHVIVADTVNEARIVSENELRRQYERGNIKRTRPFVVPKYDEIVEVSDDPTPRIVLEIEA